MPLFIDLHIDPNFTLEAVRQCHVADKEIQARYGVRYLQILLNQPQGHLFCLVEAPDKESCARVHREAHGNVACNVLEITESDFSSLLSGKHKDGSDFTMNPDGTVDTGVRAILTFSLLGTPKSCDAVRSTILETLPRLGGQQTESLISPGAFVFLTATAAIDAALEVQRNIIDSGNRVEVRIGISQGMPLSREGNFFEATRRSAEQFAFISEKGGVTLTVQEKNSYHGKKGLTEGLCRILHSPEEKLLAQLMTVLERYGTLPEISIERVAAEMGMSKSQLTRRLKGVTSFSPNELVKEFRLRKAIQLMHERGMNVAEVTMAVGFSNPSYFTKCFRTRFGQSPTEYLHSR